MSHNSDDEEDDFKPLIKVKSTKRAGSTSRNKAGRGGVACASCRAKKVSCDLVYPACGTCRTKGEEDSCSFQSLLWFDDPSEIPSAQLKAKLDRLESNIHKLRSGSQSSEPVYPHPKQPKRAVSAPSSYSPPPTPARKGSRDGEVILRLLVGSLDTSKHTSVEIDLNSLVSLVEDADAQLPLEPVPHLAEPTSLLARPSAEDLQRLMQLMPTHRQATAAIRSFFARVNPILHAVHQSSFEAQCNIFWQHGATSDGTFLATYLALCGNGLVAMGEDEATACSMPAGDVGRGLLSRSWIDGALQALSSSGFSKAPSIEGLRAVVLLNTFWASWDGGKHLEAGLTYSTMAISAIWELELHRDPDEIDGRFSALEAEERRRVFWALFSLDSLARSVLGKAYLPLDVGAISCRLPSMLESDHTLYADSSGIASVVALHSACLVLAKISKLLKSSGSTHSQVTALYEELRQLPARSTRPSSSSSRPSTPAVEPFCSILASFARIKLASGFDEVCESATDRQELYTHAHKVMDTVRSVERLSSVAATYTSIAAFSAATFLQLTACDSNAERVSEVTRSRLSSFLATLETSKLPTTVARVFVRGTTILRCLAGPTARRQQPSGYVVPASSFLGVGQSHSPVSTASGYDSHVIVDTPYYLPGNASTFIEGEQYLSPLPYDGNYENTYYPSQNVDAHAHFPPPHAGSLHTPVDQRIRHHSAPLLGPWLASAATLVSPLREFSAAPWSRVSAPLDMFA